MVNFTIEAELAGKRETLLVIRDKIKGENMYRLVKDGVEISTIKENGNLGWEVQGTPLNADELESIGSQIKAKNLDAH